MQLLRSILFNLLFFLCTAVAVILATPMLILPVAVIRVSARRWAICVFAVLRWMVGLKVEYRGDLELLRHGGLIASKHQSAWDTIVFFVLCDRPAYVMKQELMWIPFYGWLAKKQGHIGINRKGAAAALRKLIRDVRDALDDRRSVIVFPQGTRSAPGEVVSYQPGIVGLYDALKVPVVPVALNSGLFWGKRSFTKRPGTIIVEVLEPIPAGIPRKEFRAVLEERIETATRRLEAEAS